MAKITIAIPTYNRPDFLAETVRGILKQTFQDFEILIFDDASDFSIGDFLGQFNDKRIQFLRSEPVSGKKKGNRSNFERIFKYQFNSDFVIVFHDDDVMRPDLLGTSVSLLDAHPGMVWCGSTMEFVRDSARMQVFNTNNPKSKPLILRQKAELARLLMRGFHLCFDSVIYRREIMEDVGPFNDQFSKWWDRPFLMHLAGRGEVGIIRDKLVNYRIHDSQDSTAETDLPEMVLHNKKLFDFYRQQLPQPLSAADNRLFLTFSTNNLLGSARFFTRDWRSFRGFLNEFKPEYFDWKYLRPKGLWYLFKAFVKFYL